MTATKLTKQEFNRLKKKARLIPTRNAVRLSRLPKKARVKQTEQSK